MASKWLCVFLPQSLMETLDNTTWDVVISGTGLKQSLLALSLSRSGKKILHVDRNPYYGGDEAALSLTEAEAWVQRNAGSGGTFEHATVEKSEELGQSRSYSLSLAPQLIFTRSSILAALVSSKAHDQLEFQAVGSWFVIDNGLVKVPNGREDIFQDNTLDLRAKRALMKFIRHIDDVPGDVSLHTYLEESGLPSAVHAPIMALSLSSANTTAAVALPNIQRHLQSIGLFGPGFAALLPKWGLSEVAQVACRACAVGGGVYVLNREATFDEGLKIGEETVNTTWFVGEGRQKTSTWSRSIHVVADSLSQLFPPTSEGGVTPAGAVLMVPGDPPTYIFVHSSDSGECPAGQCVLYANTIGDPDRLQQAVQSTMETLGAPKILWSMRFQQTGFAGELAGDRISISSGFDLALEDSVLEEVKLVWQRITGEVDGFMQFDARNGTDENATYDDQ